ncbi:hypothetical protein M758_8G132100 [Ceratodon purpureus]|nr:hypothetical protein M758_8G132100 [Ceratodon purpureus]
MLHRMRLLPVLAICSIFFHCVTNIGGVDGAKGLYVFGDSYTDTGENMHAPYGMTWPGVIGMGNRSSDGRNEVDYLATLFEVPSPTPWEHLDANNTNNGGVNFGVGGAGVTYALGYRPLAVQVDVFEKLVNEGLWTKEHLKHSVALVSIGINDYTTFNVNGTAEKVPALTITVVDGIALNVFRIRMLGIRHIMVASLVPQTCMPYNTYWANNSTACIVNYMISNETVQHNELLENRMRLLNNAIPESSIIIINMTKAFEELFHNGEKYGFEDPYKQCCMGACGDTNTSLWTVCKDPTKSIIFDSIHPSQAGWKAAVDLYTNVSGYTVLGPKLSTWKSDHNL